MTYYSKDFKDAEGNFKYYVNPVKAIRAKCVYDCCAGSATDVEQCKCTECFLYPFRFGKNPYRTKRVLSEEEKQKRLEALRKGREKNQRI